MIRLKSSHLFHFTPEDILKAGSRKEGEKTDRIKTYKRDE
jgi:hypothetical protein